LLRIIRKKERKRRIESLDSLKNGEEGADGGGKAKEVTVGKESRTTLDARR